MASRIIVMGMVMVLGAAGWAMGADWPNWRGPNYDGVSAESEWRTDWSGEAPKVLWRRNVGVGASTVSVVGDRVYTMGNVSNEDVVWCLNSQSGEVVWRQSYACPLDRRQFEGGTAATPTVADGKVYALSHQGELRAFDAATGEPVWQVHLVNDFGGQRPRWGFAGAPLVLGNAVIVDTGSRDASTVALNKDTGQVIWKSGRQGAGYAAPIVVTLNDRQVLLSFKMRELVAMDPQTGRQLWSFEWRTGPDVNATPPTVVGKDKLFISTGYNRGCALIQVGGAQPVVLWENREMTTQVNGVVKHGDYVYGLSGNAGRGELLCMRLSDGHVMWRDGSYGTGSVKLADGKLIVMSERGGVLAVGAASEEGFKPTGRLEGLVSGRSWVAPVLSHTKIYAKDNNGNLTCVDVSQ